MIAYIVFRNFFGKFLSFHITFLDIVKNFTIDPNSFGETRLRACFPRKFQKSTTLDYLNLNFPDFM